MLIREIMTQEVYDALTAQADGIKRQQKQLKVKAANIRVQKAQKAAAKARTQATQKRRPNSVIQHGAAPVQLRV